MNYIQKLSYTLDYLMEIFILNFTLTPTKNILNSKSSLALKQASLKI